MKTQLTPFGKLLAAAIVGGVVSITAFEIITPDTSPLAFVEGTSKYAHAQARTVVVETPTGYGTGFVIQRGDKTFVWTAKHVVAKSDEVKVVRVIRNHTKKVGKIEFPARVLSRFANVDVALLQIEAPHTVFESVHFSSGNAAPGTPVFHVGNFLGPDFDNSVSKGIVSQVGVKPQEESWPWRIVDQGDFRCLPGSSGGAVFADNGSVVGILVGGPAQGAVGISCYVPVREIRAEATTEGVRWAVDSSEWLDDVYYAVPSDALLDKLAAHAKLPTLAEQFTITIEKIFGPPPTNAPPKKVLPPKH